MDRPLSLRDLQEVLQRFATALWKSARDLSPIVITIILFQFLVIQQPLENLTQVVVGLVLVIVGLTFFVVGLESGLFPLGEQMARDFARRGSVFWLSAFAFSLGFGATFAEPALIAIATKAAESQGLVAAPEEQQAIRASYALGLRIVVASAVGASLVVSVIRIILGWPLQYFVISGYFLVLGLSGLATRDVLAVAYDTGGVATSTITVPLMVVLGIGLASSIRGRSPLIDGLGTIAVASLSTTFCVLVWGMLRP